MEENDVQLQLKKRARRRLVGAVAFVSVVAVVLPMVMDNEPRQVVQDVEIRIPGQDEKPFAPRFAEAPLARPADPAPPAAEPEARPVPAPEVRPTARVVEVVKDKPSEKPPAKPEKPSDKPVDKPAAKPPEKPADKNGKNDEARRAAALLSGQPVEAKATEAKPAAKSGEYLVLIGAFANEANVRNLKAKLGEQGIKTFSEPLDTPQGRKTRLRAGPFPSREAADKALEKMQKIGVSGVVSAK